MDRCYRQSLKICRWFEYTLFSNYICVTKQWRQGGGREFSEFVCCYVFQGVLFEKDMHFYCLTIKLRTIFELNLNV